ncbi:Inositol 2-dehydrogenase [Aquisphaera giovannonii]|uniref:Inositol 2-dehydrogenase n=1 Tax=Aquisphaera giovannonii TaxID=406548 RepID=A0A5B9W7X2_9BACT|nr:Gfo/Idh/MocA family oxidoreductase [Aquisphaera giovannonii]QEH36663.1 Inositol 2-dehydrogenase [Aquisphaera giovannonii]
MQPGAGATRRRFMRGAASAIAVPTIVPSSVFGRGGKAAPSDRITVAFIGCGKMANDYHLPELLKMGDVQALAVCEVDARRRDHAKKRVEKAYSGKSEYKGCAAYNDFREIIGRKDIDAVCIATPEHWHAIPAIEAMKAGKDVYCEKPLTLTLAEGRRCIDVARKYDRVFQTGSQQRSNVFGDFRQAAEIIRSGRLGQVVAVTVGVGGPSRPCDLPEESMEPGLDWDLWLGPAPMRPYNSTLSPRGVHDHFPEWRRYREYAGGAHADMGAHHYDIAQWCLGMDQSDPVEIIPPVDPRAGHGVAFRYANGVMIVHGGPSGCTFTGTKGTLHIDRGELSSDPEKIVKEPLKPDEVHLEKSPGHHRNWLDCIRSRKRPLADVEIGARSVALTILGNLAYWNHRTLRWDPQKWEFIGDPEANRWLDRERRGPWQLPAV